METKVKDIINKVLSTKTDIQIISNNTIEIHLLIMKITNDENINYTLQNNIYTFNNESTITLPINKTETIYL